MNADPKVPDIDETPEYPLPSPTDSLGRDQRPPDDDAGVERVPDDDVKNLSLKQTRKIPTLPGMMRPASRVDWRSIFPPTISTTRVRTRTTAALRVLPVALSQLRSLCC